MKERLQKVMAQAGYGSRRACEEIIRQGRVTVNGLTSKLGDKVDLSEDEIFIDGKQLEPAQLLVYRILNKPPGYLSSTRSQGGNPTVLDLMSCNQRIYPVGRLDLDSEGLILLTNDGPLTQRLTHPSFEHEKEYRVLLDRKPDDEQLRHWRNGVILSDGYKTHPAQVSLGGSDASGFWIEVVLREGRKHQIRETAEILGLDVIRLIRVRMATLEIGSLLPGEWRELEPDEIARLRKLL